MIYKTLMECLLDLEKNNDLIRIREEVDPDLEMAEIHRRVHKSKGPAILFEKVKGSPFPAVSNIFGTYSRTKFIFRSTLKDITALMNAKADPLFPVKNIGQAVKLPLTLKNALPKKISYKNSGLRKIKFQDLPMIKSWPDDGGPFVLLPQVFSEDPLNPGIMKSNLGMYRIQMAGNEYKKGEEIGLHYQIRRDIGIHHSNAIKKGEPLKVSIFVGGPPAHTFAAVMPLPEGIPEVSFAGALGGRRFRYVRKDGYVLSADADFCITGTIVPGETKPEGPFGDHLGYYSLTHDFPFLKVDSVYCSKNAVWPFTIVGRPPQEDSLFGKLIHEITKPVLPTSLPGVVSINAVDAAGVHPLLLATAKERYVPYRKKYPMELLTHANAILGFGHCALAKYLFIADADDIDCPDAGDIKEFFIYVLERINLERDLHFQTKTTIDTLDYSGTSINEGSKVVIAAAGPKIRILAESVPDNFILPEGFSCPEIIIPGVAAVSSPVYKDREQTKSEITILSESLIKGDWPNSIPFIILTEDSSFMARSLNNYLWVTYTRSNPSHDIHGAESYTDNKHWGCKGPLIIDARLKAHHAPPLVEDEAVVLKVNERFNF